MGLPPASGPGDGQHFRGLVLDIGAKIVPGGKLHEYIPVGSAESEPRLVDVNLKESIIGDAAIVRGEPRSLNVGDNSDLSL